MVTTPINGTDGATGGSGTRGADARTHGADAASDASHPLIPHLDDPVALTRALCDIPSESGQEGALADAVFETLEHLSARGPGLQIHRDGDAVVARTQLGRAERVVIAGHLDTVPIQGNVPARWESDAAGEQILVARGACDMKAGVAMQLSVLHRVPEPSRDVTLVFYDHEEVAAELNGLRRLAERRPDLLHGDFAVLGEPTSAGIEGGCNGTMRVEVRTTGVRAHSARAWKGVNAIHAAAAVLQRLADFEAPAVEVDGLVFQESLSAVGIRGGVAGNVIPDECVVTVNYRFAPHWNASRAEAFLREFFAGWEVTVTDAAEGARPGLDVPAAADFVRAIGGTPAAKVGWTDVARFSALGIPAVNFGPGDPLFAHKEDEHVRPGEIHRAVEALCSWLEDA